MYLDTTICRQVCVVLHVLHLLEVSQHIYMYMQLISVCSEVKTCTHHLTACFLILNCILTNTTSVQYISKSSLSVYVYLCSMSSKPYSCTLFTFGPSLPPGVQYIGWRHSYNTALSAALRMPQYRSRAKTIATQRGLLDRKRKGVTKVNMVVHG